MGALGAPGVVERRGGDVALRIEAVRDVGQRVEQILRRTPRVEPAVSPGQAGGDVAVGVQLADGREAVVKEVGPALPGVLPGPQAVGAIAALEQIAVLRQRVEWRLDRRLSRLNTTIRLASMYYNQGSCRTSNAT